MDNVRNCDSYIDIPSSQTYRQDLLRIGLQKCVRRSEALLLRAVLIEICVYASHFHFIQREYIYIHIYIYYHRAYCIEINPLISQPSKRQYRYD
jgi:hypothetical protein